MAAEEDVLNANSILAQQLATLEISRATQKQKTLFKNQTLNLCFHVKVKDDMGGMRTLGSSTLFSPAR